MRNKPLLLSNMGLKRIPAYAAIYILWGGAYLAVRILVQVFPPFLVAGLRYTFAALFLIPVLLLRSDPAPSLRQLINSFWTGTAMLTVGYGVVFWAERRLPSWIVAVLISTTFLWTYLGESLVLRWSRFQGRMLFPLFTGLAGIVLLVGGSFHLGRVSALPVVAVLLGAFSWSAGSLAVQSIDMPRSYIQIAAYQLATSGLLLLCLSGGLGEWARLPATIQIFAWKQVLAMAYLVVASSVVAFAAYHWLMAREPASLVATSAYVNPIVAMLLGIVAAGERYSSLQLTGALTVLGSIVAIWCLQSSVARSRSSTLKTVPDL